MFKMLEEHGVKTHYVEEISDRETIVKNVKIVPIEVIVRNIAAGSLSKRLGLPEGTKLKSTVLEYSYKDDELPSELHPHSDKNYILSACICQPFFRFFFKSS